MYATTDLYKTLLANPLHWKETKLDIAGTEYTEANIISAVIPPSALYEKFGIGNCVARELDLEVFPIGDIPRQAQISVYVRLVLGDQVSEWVPQGVFFISTRKKNKLTGALTITAFDAMLKAEDIWLTEDYDLDDWPKSQQEAVEDIAQRMGVEVDSRTVLSDDFPVDYPVDEYGDLSMREVLSGISISNTANWVISMEGKLMQVSAVEAIDDVLTENVDISEFVANTLGDMDIGEPSRPVSKVILNVDSGAYYTAGVDGGSTIEADCSWATQEMANSVLAKAQGYIYLPFDGTDALLDPAVELGDAITISGTTCVLAKLGRNLDRQGVASIGAPGNDEIEDEYPYKSKQRRQTDRILAATRAEIQKTAESILLKVENSNGNLSELEQTVDSLSSRVETAEGDVSTLEQKVDGIKLTVTNDGTSSYFELTSGATVLSSGNITFDGFVTFLGLASGTTTIDGGCIKTGTILADLITAGVLQSDDGETFVLDLDNGTFKMKGTGRFQSGDGRTYIEMDGDEIVLYTTNDSGTVLDKLHIGVVSADGLDYPYVRFGAGTGANGTAGLVKKFTNGLWLGNSVPQYMSGDFEGASGAAGFFVDIATGESYVVSGKEMKNVYTGESIAKFG